MEDRDPFGNISLLSIRNECRGFWGYLVLRRTERGNGDLTGLGLFLTGATTVGSWGKEFYVLDWLFKVKLFISRSS